MRCNSLAISRAADETAISSLNFGTLRLTGFILPSELEYVIDSWRQPSLRVWLLTAGNSVENASLRFCGVRQSVATSVFAENSLKCVRKATTLSEVAFVYDMMMAMIYEYGYDNGF